MKSDCPPGTVHFKDHLFIDKTEIRNIDYREYLYWLKRVKGEESTEYLNAIPDTTVWYNHNDVDSVFAIHYFKHPAYFNYPVVGVSYIQAVGYCKWRSDRVNEWYLIKNGKLTINDSQSTDKQAYIDSLVKENQRFVYRLPTKEEWEQAALAGQKEVLFGWGTSAFRKISGRKKGCRLGNFKAVSSADANASENYATVEVEHYWPNRLGLLNMSGNVSEMTDEEGLAKGGAWNHYLKELQINAQQKYNKPEAWLGFRCICEEINLKNE